MVNQNRITNPDSRHANNNNSCVFMVGADFLLLLNFFVLCWTQYVEPGESAALCRQTFLEHCTDLAWWVQMPPTSWHLAPDCVLGVGPRALLFSSCSWLLSTHSTNHAKDNVGPVSRKREPQRAFIQLCEFYTHFLGTWVKSLDFPKKRDIFMKL